MHEHTTHTTIHRDPVEPVRNIDRLTDRLWVGGDLPADLDQAISTLSWWHDLGIRTIIDTRAEWSDERLVRQVAPDMTYVHLGQDDAGQRIPGGWFEKIVEAARAGFARDGAVVAHCHMGINRGPTAVFSILLDQGWDPVDAIDHVRSCRPIAAVGYAEDALRWLHDRHDLDNDQRLDQRRRLHQWRHDHPHDTVRIIRQIRQAEAIGWVS